MHVAMLYESLGGSMCQLPWYPRQAESMEELEELWAPYKAKRQTRAQMAKAKGLEPLDARLCWNLQPCTPMCRNW